MKILYLYILKNSFLCIVLWKIGGKGLQKKRINIKQIILNKKVILNNMFL